MFDRLTDRARQVMSTARREAQRFNHEYIGTEHILLGLVQEGSGIGAKVLRNLDVNPERIRHEVEKLIPHGPPTVTMGQLPFTPRAKRVLELAQDEANNLGQDEIGTEHLLLGLLREHEGVAAQVLMNFGVKLEDVREEVLEVVNCDVLPAKQTAHTPGEEPGSRHGTCVLDRYGTDLTALAAAGKLDPVIGRRREIDRVVQVLGRRGKNSPVLVGEPGVGKTAIVEGLAQEIAAGTCHASLRGHRIVALDFAYLVAGIRFWSDIENLVSAFVKDLRSAKNVIVFLDEVETLLGLRGAKVTRVASSAFTRALAAGEFRCLATSTRTNFSRIVGKRHGPLRRRFETIPVAPQSRQEALAVLEGLRDRYEAHYAGVTYSDAALRTCVDLAARFLPSRLFPEKAIDLMDEAGARARLAATPEPTAEEAALTAEISRRDREKDAAIAAQQFETAAHARDQAAALCAQRYVLRRQSAADASAHLVVDERAVAETLALMLGLPLAAIAAPADPPPDPPPPSPPPGPSA